MHRFLKAAIIGFIIGGGFIYFLNRTGFSPLGLRFGYTPLPVGPLIVTGLIFAGLFFLIDFAFYRHERGYKKRP